MKFFAVLATSVTLVLLAHIGLVFADAGNAKRGSMLYESRCTGCHSLDENRVGPRHRGVFGRPAGAVDDYEYSDALRQSGIKWDAATLENWLRDPEALIAGQKMNYRVRTAADRGDLIAFLKSLSSE